MSPSPPSTPQSPPNPKHGVFRNERWLCNCDPRLDAAVKTVTKKTKNNGRRFYGCPKYGEGNYCDMFLFVEDAKPREWECLMSNGRSEKRQTTLPESMTPSKGKRRLEDATTLAEVDDPRAVVNGASAPKSATASTSGMAALPRNSDNPSSAAQTSTLKGSNGVGFSRPKDFYDTTSEEDDDEEETNNHVSRTANKNNLQSSAIAATPTTQPTGSKRKRPSEEEKKENFLDDLSSGAEEELLTVTERSSRIASTLGKQRNTFITPSATRTTDAMQNGLPTPSLTKATSVKKVLFKDEVEGEICSHDATTANPKRQRHLQEDGTTPTSHASRLFGTDATIGPSPSPPPPPAPNTNLTGEIMALLKDEDITPSVRNEVRRTLEIYVNQAKGYERGRDASRKAGKKAVKDAEDRAAALQKRIDGLERSRQELRSQLMDMWGRV
ncbi:hypothetical protein F5B21DRAFT_501122 [Xylaria acuta]|nr:hypothetical protein F5B21DRAFT_501122 [Xylaria acuta]